MRITRERVDELLAQGRIEDAEAYMNERRLEFVANGYYIRRLNQAYFAFHGSYRTGPAAPADDPILPRLESLRAQSDSLAQFVATVRDISSFEDLLALVPAP
jgi:DNA-binding Lrp family transcriptional regulator